MIKYYCPFCSFFYKFPKTRCDEVLLCEECGEHLIKKPLIKPRQILGLFAATSFITPLLLMIAFLINDFTKENPPNDSKNLVLLFYK